MALYTNLIYLEFDIYSTILNLKVQVQVIIYEHDYLFVALFCISKLHSDIRLPYKNSHRQNRYVICRQQINFRPEFLLVLVRK